MNKLTNYLKFIFWGLLMMVVSMQISAATNYYFYIQLADKNNTPYTLSNPSAFLSEKAIARRMLRAPIIDSTDLPIDPSYLSQIQNLGILIHSKSRWLNGVTALLADSSKMSAVRALPFVKFVQYTGKTTTMSGVGAAKVKQVVNFDYGAANLQISQLSGKYLHNAGYRGKGITIGVLDAGYTNVNVNHAFDSLRLQGRLLGVKDIVEPMSNIYVQDTHGAHVLSTMAGNLPGSFLGTAPDAAYWLIRTEYAPTEYLVETDFWCAGIEYADSVGVDVLNSSLGYATFDDPKMNFTYADMNGNVSRASRAATLAAKKGIVVLNSAGNDGNDAWHYISSPADAHGIITVGAVQNDSISSLFSSFGPSFDGRIKPEVACLGTAASVVNISGVPTSGNGTSYASPIMAGMVACYLQFAMTKNPSCSVETLLHHIYASAHLYGNPTAQKGYGIPDFQLAMHGFDLANSTLGCLLDNNYMLINNSASKTIFIRNISIDADFNGNIRIYSMRGEVVASQTIQNLQTIFHTDTFPAGVYAVCITSNGNSCVKKVLIEK